MGGAQRLFIFFTGGRRFANPIYLPHLEYISKKNKTKSTWYSADNEGLCRTVGSQLIFPSPGT